MRLKDTQSNPTHSRLFLIMATATLDLPVNLAVSVLRSAGTGDSLLAALDALVTVNTDEVEVADVTDTADVNAVDA